MFAKLHELKMLTNALHSLITMLVYIVCFLTTNLHFVCLYSDVEVSSVEYKDDCAGWFPGSTHIKR